MAAERWLCSACGANSEPTPEPPPGCPRCDAPLYVGKYGLLAELPAERSARVFRGRESRGPAEVTVRLFPGDLLPSLPGMRRAVRNAATLDHPTIAAPLDAGAHRNLVYVIETWAPGEPVLQCELTLREAAGVVRDAALALAHAEDRGIVHPDLRPENIRVRRVPGKGLGESDLRVLLTCFGIAESGNARRNVRMLGTVLFTLATGRAPREWSPESPSEINPLVGSMLESIILTAMESDPSRQAPGARQIAHELQQYLDGGAKVPTESVLKTPEEKNPARSRIPPRAVALSAAAAAILIAFVILVTPHREAPSEVPVAKVRGTPTESLPPPSKPPPETPKPVEPVPPAEPVKVVEHPRSAEPVQPGVPPKPVEPPKPAAPAKPPEPVQPPPEPPPPPPAPVKGSIGLVQGIHPEYGVFVKLEGGGKIASGEVLEVMRKGEVVARLKVDWVTAPEKLYPNGCAVCKAEQGEPAQGDSVRRAVR